MTKPHILVICTANICRSPLAEALLRRYLADDGYDDWTVSSAGTWALDRRGAAPYSIEMAAERGLDIEGHRSRMVTTDMLSQADLVLCMAGNHAEALQVEFPQYADKVYRLSEMVGARYDIADPYGGPRPEYERMAREVERLIADGLSRIVELARADTPEDATT